jgi:hypothetical protein
MAVRCVFVFTYTRENESWEGFLAKLRCCRYFIVLFSFLVAGALASFHCQRFVFVQLSLFASIARVAVISAHADYLSASARL